MILQIKVPDSVAEMDLPTKDKVVLEVLRAINTTLREKADINDGSFMVGLAGMLGIMLGAHTEMDEMSKVLDTTTKLIRHSAMQSRQIQDSLDQQIREATNKDKGTKH